MADNKRALGTGAKGDIDSKIDDTKPAAGDTPTEAERPQPSAPPADDAVARPGNASGTTTTFKKDS